MIICIYTQILKNAYTFELTGQCSVLIKNLVDNKLLEVVVVVGAMMLVDFFTNEVVNVVDSFDN